MARFLNALAPPSIISQLEACRANWGIPRYVYPRWVRALSLNSCLKRARTHEEMPADGRGEGAPCTKRSIIQLYGYRLRHVSVTTAPMGPHPWAPPSSWKESSWAIWIRPCSLFERHCVVRRGGGAYAWNSPSRVVRVTPYLNFCASSEAAGKYYY